MFFKIIHLVYLAIFFLMAFGCVLFKNTDGKMWNRFRRSMANKETSRKLYMMVLALAVLFHDLAFFKVYGPSLWQMPGFVFGLVLLRNSWSETMLTLLRTNRLAQILAFAVVMISMIEQQLFTLSAAIGILFAFSVGYPSREVISMAEKNAKSGTLMDDAEIHRLY